MSRSKDKTFKFSKNDQESLQHLSDLLHLFHHRNKNQHRRGIWWRHLSVFRRQLNSLLDEVQNLNEVPTTHLARTQKKARDGATQRKISQRLELWESLLVSKWQNSFSQLVADGRFAVLGLVLVAALAQSCKITGITDKFDELGQIEVEKVLDEFGKGDWENLSNRDNVHREEDEDLGEAVAREGDVDMEGITGINSGLQYAESDVKVMESRPASRIMISKPTKKKRKRGNAIDDLFSGLG